MEQTILARKYLYEAAVRHDAAHCSVIYLANLWDCHDGTNLCQGTVDALLVRTANLYLANAFNLIDGDGGTGVLLHLLDNLSARTDNCTDKLFWNLNLYDAWNLWLQLWARLCYGLDELAEDVLTTSLCLHQCLLENLEAQTVALDIHLCSCQTVLGTCGLEVHIAQVVLVAEDVAQYCILVLSRILYKTHGDAAHWLCHWHTGVHKSQCTGTYCCHRRRTVGLKNLANQTYSVWIVGRYLSFEGTPSEVAMTNLTSSDTS